MGGPGGRVLLPLLSYSRCETPANSGSQGPEQVPLALEVQDVDCAMSETGCPCRRPVVDLKDAYFQIPIWKGLRRFLRFAFDGKTFEFCVLPFGISRAPRGPKRVGLCQQRNLWAMVLVTRRLCVALRSWKVPWNISRSSRLGLVLRRQVISVDASLKGWDALHKGRGTSGR